MMRAIVLPTPAVPIYDRVVNVPFAIRVDGPSVRDEMWTLVDLESGARASVRTRDVYRHGYAAVYDAIEELKRHRRFAGDLLTRHWRDGEE